MLSSSLFPQDLLAHQLAQVWISSLQRGQLDSLDPSSLQALGLKDIYFYNDREENSEEQGGEGLIEGERVDLKRFHQRGEGKMFGLLLCKNDQGEFVLLRAYSGQLQGLWSRPTWAPPLFNLSNFALDSWLTQAQLHILTQCLQESKAFEGMSPDEVITARKELKDLRRESSRVLTQTIHQNYRLTNIDGVTRSLWELWPSAPTGTGDCCAPKLISWSSSLHLTPVGLAEFWWGAPQRALRSGSFYPPCQRRCQPLLSFLIPSAPSEESRS